MREVCLSSHGEKWTKINEKDKRKREEEKRKRGRERNQRMRRETKRMKIVSREEIERKMGEIVYRLWGNCIENMEKLYREYGEIVLVIEKLKEEITGQERDPGEDIERIDI